MPSYLGDYHPAASRRDEKIVRAVNSVINQTFEDWQLIVVADGCQKTVDIISKITDKRVSVIYIEKAPFWDGLPRNTGIENAEGELITYIDNDDYWGVNHLKILHKNIGNYD